MPDHLSNYLNSHMPHSKLKPTSCTIPTSKILIALGLIGIMLRGASPLFDFSIGALFLLLAGVLQLIDTKKNLGQSLAWAQRISSLPYIFSGLFFWFLPSAQQKDLLIPTLFLLLFTNILRVVLAIECRDPTRRLLISTYSAGITTLVTFTILSPKANNLYPPEFLMSLDLLVQGWTLLLLQPISQLSKVQSNAQGDIDDLSPLAQQATSR